MVGNTHRRALLSFEGDVSFMEEVEMIAGWVLFGVGIAVLIIVILFGIYCSNKFKDYSGDSLSKRGENIGEINKEIMNELKKIKVRNEHPPRS